MSLPFAKISPPKWLRGKCPEPPRYFRFHRPGFRKLRLSIHKPPARLKPFRPCGLRFGDAQSDAARLAAVNAGAAVHNRYNGDNSDFTADQQRYNEAIALWNQRGGNMSPADHNACYGYLTMAYMYLGNEHSALTLAFQSINAGDAEIVAGDAAADPNKTPHYMNASSDYNAAGSNCGVDESNHTSFGGAMSSAETILNNYG